MDGRRGAAAILVTRIGLLSDCECIRVPHCISIHASPSIGVTRVRLSRLKLIRLISRGTFPTAAPCMRSVAMRSVFLLEIYDVQCAYIIIYRSSHTSLMRSGLASCRSKSLDLIDVISSSLRTLPDAFIHMCDSQFIQAS
jgi:hypothetical protein